MIARRQLLQTTVAFSGMGLVGAVGSSAAWAILNPTSRQSTGPFYPTVKPADQDTDLTAIAGQSGRADGQIVDLTGRVLDRQGRPIAGAHVEIWQANRQGRYAHPRDRSSAPLDPGFQGYGVAVTDGDGRYAFRTIKPSAYPTGGAAMRPPHIHFAVTGPDQRLVTQMYFPGEPLNERDGLLNRADDPASLIADVTPAGNALAARWDIVLA